MTAGTDTEKGRQQLATQALKVREERPAHLPRPGTYWLDAERCVVDATARQPWLSTARARFTVESGRLVVERDPLASWVQVDLQAGSLSTGLAARDEALLGPAGLDAANFPLIRFESAVLKHREGMRFEVEADLYIRDRTVPVSVQARLADVGPGRVRVAATGTVSWRALGLGWDSTMERIGVLGGRITVAAAAEFVA